VVNRTKQGHEYWVEANISPIIKSGQHIGYVSVRAAASDAQILEAKALYARIEKGASKLVKGVEKKSSGRWMRYVNPIEFMKRFSITGKFLIAAIPALMALFFYMGMSIFSDYKNVQSYTLFTEEAQLSSILSDWVHESQKERGMSAGYIGSNGQKFKTELPTQQTRFNEQFKIYQDALATGHLYELPAFKKRFELIEQKTAQLQTIRQGVLNNTLDISKALAFYTSLNKLMLDTVAEVANEMKDPEIANIVFAFESYLKSKERAGIERAVLTNTFAKDSFGPGFYEKFVRLVAEQDAYMDGFINHTPPESKANYEQMIQHPSFKQVKAFRALASEKAMTGGFGVDPTQWFTIITDKIQQLKALDNQIAETINSKINVKLEQAKSNFYRDLLILIFVLSIVIFLMVGAVTSITRPLKIMTEFMKQGRLDRRVKMLPSNDEVYQITQSFNHLMNLSQFAVNSVNESVQQLAKGDFTHKVDYEIGGEMDRLKHSMNTSLEVVSNAMQEIESSLGYLSNGDFKQTLTISEEFKGTFHDILHSAQLTLNQVDTAVTEINEVASHMAQGQFNTTINAEMKGSLNDVKLALNDALSQVNKSISAISRTVTANSQGDLTAMVQGNFSGELKQLQEGVNSSLTQIRNLITDANGLSNSVATSAHTIAQSNRDLSARSQEQAASLEETAASMEEMTAIVQQNADNAKQANTLSLKTVNASELGVEGMKNTTRAMNSIQDASAQISDIVSLIDSIAFQTNLLALNAAVEAARAGEHGRGFAVVAGEVRSLAQKSADAAKDIKLLVDRTTNQIEAGTKLVNQSSQSFDDINGNIANVSQLIEQIAQSIHEQSQGIAQVNSAITKIDRDTQETSQIVSQASSEADGMNQDASEFKEVMSKFKIS